MNCSSLDDPCNVGVCNVGNGLCEAQPTNEGGSCSDGELCTTGDICQVGSCAGSAVDCSSLDDPWVRPATAAYHPAALDIVMRAEGHLGLVGSERARAVAMEHLVGDAVQRTS